MKKADIKQESIKNLLDYNPETGEFFYKYDMSVHCKAGCKVLMHKCNDVMKLKLSNDTFVMAKYVAWVWMYGDLSHGIVKHKNDDIKDLRIDNLYLGTKAKNGTVQSKYYKKYTEPKRKKYSIRRVAGKFLVFVNEKYFAYCHSEEEANEKIKEAQQ
jgi:hypothetical protein